MHGEDVGFVISTIAGVATGYVVYTYTHHWILAIGLGTVAFVGGLGLSAAVSE